MMKAMNEKKQNLEAIVKSLCGKSIQSAYKEELKLSQKEADELIQHLIDTGMLTIKWLPEKETLCFVKKELVN